MKPLLLNKKIKFTSYTKIIPQLDLDIPDIEECEFILHDGPPFANGNLHAGHGVNKLLKDFINRLMLLYNRKISYRPGWDCHGLPIENAVAKKEGSVTLGKCREHAEHWIEKQKETFKSLGVLGNWNDPYITMNKEYEYNVISALYEAIESQYIYRGKRPIMWSIHESTSLSDAEIEYKDKISKSIYVLFKTKIQNTYILIWTTTPWTLPANQAICFNKNIDYKCITIENKNIWIASSMIDTILQKKTINKYKIRNDIAFPSRAYHPFIDREILLIHGEHVSDESGTGFVHTAPAYGIEDFNICKQHNIDPIEIIDKYGRFTIDILNEYKINNCFDRIEELLSDNLFYSEDYMHSYPHSWRSKKPIIYMLSDQWFFDINKVKQSVIEQLKTVNFYPDNSSNRMISMIMNRDSWCISRQRKWGIPLMFCIDENNNIDLTVKDQILNLVKEKGTSFWFEDDVQQLFTNQPVMEIMDVWFESGLSYLTLNGKKANLYLEGSDQHRGWFQSSAILSMALNKQLPYEAILTHGFIVSKPGEKLSKSKGSESLDDIINQYGPDTFRIFVANSNCIGNDIIFDRENLQVAKETLMKLRNTLKFLLANIDIVESKDIQEYNLYSPLDQYVLYKIYHLDIEINQYLKQYETHKIFQTLKLFCIDLSNIYFGSIKDPLYCNSLNSTSRRSIISIFKILLHNLCAWLKIFIPFAIQEIINFTKDLYSKIKIKPEWNNPHIEIKFRSILSNRAKIMKILENKRSNELIKSNLDVSLSYPFQEDEGLMEQVLGISKYQYSHEIKVEIKGNKCQRCWKYYMELNNELCLRCSS